jgi:carboxymethylenebutenolidase
MYHGQFAIEPDEARKLVMNMNREQALKDLLGSVAYLQSLDTVAPKKLGCIGFCMGGRLTFSLAAATPDIAAGAPFYGGTPTADELMPINAELYCAYGADDGGIPVDNVRAMEAALASQGKSAVVKVYDGAPHSFFNDTKESYRAEAAKDAWSNVLALFKRRLV